MEVGGDIVIAVLVEVETFVGVLVVLLVVSLVKVLEKAVIFMVM